MRITSEHSPLSFLSQRLAYASRNRIRAINLVENVPVWPARFRPELHERAQPDIFHYAPAEGDETLLRLLLERENARAGEEDGTLTTGTSSSPTAPRKACPCCWVCWILGGQRSFANRRPSSA